MTDIDRHHNPIDDRIGEPEKFVFPDGYTLSRSWKRAQTDPAIVGPVDSYRWQVLLGSGSPREVLFTIVGGDLRAECTCEGWKHRGFCAHVAHLWIRWTRDNLCVVDEATGRTHRHPPAWLRIPDKNAMCDKS